MDAERGHGDGAALKPNRGKDLWSGSLKGAGGMRFAPGSRGRWDRAMVAAMSGSKTGGPSVLLIYPSGATARGMADALQGEKIAVEAVENVYKAISSFTARPADLVLIGLGDVDERDLEVIRVLRELNPEVYVVLSFPTAHRDRAVRALALGADSYLLEPFYLGEFLDLVRRGLVRSTRGTVAGNGEDLERLAGAVAHAINNPLQILELLLTDDGGSGPDPEEFRHEAERVKEVVNELLSFARREENRPEPLDLNALVRETFPPEDDLRTRIRTDLAEDLPEIVADPIGMRRVLRALSLLSHARGQGGPLEISTVAPEGARGRVTLRVRASELLLSDEEQDSMFQPFAGPIQGVVGLSGATAGALIRANGGTVAVESREGEGTTVAIGLPLARTDVTG